MKRICLIVSRIKKDLTQKQVAKMIEVSQQTVNKWELGTATPKTFKIMNKLSEVLGKDKSALFPDIFETKGCDGCSGNCSCNSKGII